jgi:hypothetical protein
VLFPRRLRGLSAAVPRVLPGSDARRPGGAQIPAVPAAPEHTNYRGDNFGVAAAAGGHAGGFPDWANGAYGSGGPLSVVGPEIVSCKTAGGVLEFAVKQTDVPLLLHYISPQARKPDR